MADKRIGSVIVNEDTGEFLGIFTVTDALNALIEITRSRETQRSGLGGRGAGHKIGFA